MLTSVDILELNHMPVNYVIHLSWTKPGSEYTCERTQAKGHSDVLFVKRNLLIDIILKFI